MQQQLFILSITILLCAVWSSPATTSPITAPPSSSSNSTTPCNMDVQRICSSIVHAENYSLKLNTDSFHRYGEVKVQVHATQCLLDSHSQLPWWYHVEMIEILDSMGSGSGSGSQSSSTGAAGVSGSGSEQRKAGKFYIPRPRRHEMTLCNQDSTLVFSSCSPTLLDIPREFVWRLAHKYTDKDSLCFRLTIQLNGEESCGQREVCLSVGDVPKPPGYDNTQDDTITYIQIVSNNMGTGSAHHEYGVVDDEDVLEIIREEYEIEDINTGVVVPAEKGCFIAKEFYIHNKINWIPDCTCDGDYKAIQCVDLEEGRQCWCSLPNGSEVQHSRKTLNCTDPESFEFKC